MKGIFTAVFAGLLFTAILAFSVTEDSFLSNLSGAQQVASVVSANNLKLSLEMYHLNNNSYPQAKSTEELMDILKKEGFLDKKGNVSRITYSVSKDLQKYELSVD